VADRDGANQCAPPLDVPSMEGLGHSLMTLLNAALRATPLGANLLSIASDLTTNLSMPRGARRRQRSPGLGHFVPLQAP